MIVSVATVMPGNAQLAVAECGRLWCINAGAQSGVWRSMWCRYFGF